ncbi:MAG: lactate utilization protein [Lachnospiraceae bacterium]|nr:lactate utilization protein [Lachnospiraceae bacterium]
MSYKKEAYAKTAAGIIKNLEKRNMEGYYFENKEDMVKAVLEMMPENSIISWGGSASITESGMMDALKSGNYTLIDRMTAKTPQESREIFAKTVMSDYFFCSTNAITLNGELVNIDGNGNRVACIIHGPAHVMMIVGMNKVVSDVESAVKRIRTNACPPNAVRLNLNTPCALTGSCADCQSPDCFCCQIAVTRRSRHAGRIKVFLVGEELGF